MKLQKLNCPNCNGLLNIELTQKSDYIFCPYCGQQFHIDSEKREYTFNKNININKTINHIKRNETEIEKAKASVKETKFELIFGAFMIVFLFGCMIACFTVPALLEKISAEKEKQAGKINIGSHYDYEEKDYEFVVAEFQALGFEDIEIIDLDDAGLFKNKADTVESVSVKGNSKFTWQDYFFITDKVIITHH